MINIETKKEITIKLDDFDYSNPNRVANIKQFQKQTGYSIIPVSYFEPIPDLRNIDLREDYSKNQIMDITFKYNDAWIDPDIKEKLRNIPSEILNNPMMPHKDIEVYGHFIQYFQPNHIIEIGSGYSGCFAGMFCRMFKLNTKIDCIEPFPNRLLTEFSKSNWIGLIEKPVQDISREEIEIIKQLRPNDILFIDTSHVSLRSSDTNYIFINLFPLIKSGVIIHVHDIFLPYDYQDAYYKVGRFYNEQYLLASILANSNQFETLYSSYYNHVNNKGGYGGSFWMKKR